MLESPLTSFINEKLILVLFIFLYIELICANPDNIKQMLDNPEDPLTEDILMKCLIRECGKERLEYKIVALEATSKVLQAMDLNYFKPLYEMLIPFIRKAFDEEIERKKREESEKNEDNELESKQAKKSNEDEAETFSLDLQLASVECLGQAWPETPETQNEFIEELLNILDAMIKNTTRKLQVISNNIFLYLIVLFSLGRI